MKYICKVNYKCQFKNISITHCGPPTDLQFQPARVCINVIHHHKIEAHWIFAIFVFIPLTVWYMLARVPNGYRYLLKQMKLNMKLLIGTNKFLLYFTLNKHVIPISKKIRVRNSCRLYENFRSLNYCKSNWNTYKKRLESKR